MTVVALSTIAAGPAPSKPSATAREQAETIAFTQRKPKAMTAGGPPTAVAVPATTGGIIGALIGGLIVEHMAGAKLVKEHELVDPAGEMARELAHILADHRNAAVLPQPVVVKRERPKAIAKISGGARHIVDVRTRDWSLIGLADDRRKDATYWGELKVIDGAKGDVLVETECRWTAPVLQKPSKLPFEQDSREVTQDHFATAREVCVRQFALAMKSLYTVPNRPITPSFIAASSPDPVRVDTRVAPPTAVAAATLPPVSRPAPPPPAPVVPPRREIVGSPPPPVAMAVAAERREVRQTAQTAVEEYAYARPNEAPPARKPQPEYRYAGRDANGYLVWPGKRP